MTGLKGCEFKSQVHQTATLEEQGPELLTCALIFGLSYKSICIKAVYSFVSVKILSHSGLEDLEA